MEWLNLVARPQDAYMFDMFLDPNERGNGMAAYLQHNALLLLKEKGFEKAYGYFLADNIPALWVHRLLKWDAIKKVYTKRIIRRWVIGEETIAETRAAPCKEGA
jgi:GNAT superfamily N-acetyltransferase